MGAWGVGSFENDDAADWVAGLDEISLADLTGILSQAADDPAYLEGPAASVAVAAGEVVAALNGGTPARPRMFGAAAILVWVCTPFATPAIVTAPNR